MFLLIDNYDSFTYNLVQYFYHLGHRPVVMKNDDPDVMKLVHDPNLQMVCISPGPGRPEDSGYCIPFLKELNPQIPVLGVCLGHQILGSFAGAEVVVGPQIMHGKVSEIVHDGTGLFANIPNPMRVGRYHSLVVKSDGDTDNPQFTVTARGPEGEVMALRYNDRPWVGVQFHPESILTPDGLRLMGNFPQAVMPSMNTEYVIGDILNTLANRQDLTSEQASFGFSSLFDGKMTASQAGSFLMGLRMKGESPMELAHATRAALARAVRVDGIEGKCIDVVGTGGDGKHSFNCSTATALTLAGMGYKVVKHGNRAVSSRSGSADVLERLGVTMEQSAEKVAELVRDKHFAFLFAPYFHPEFRNVAPLRKEMHIRTLFNLLGPMINPARPSHLLLGVATPELIPLISETLKLSKLYKAAVVYGAGGYDEITPLGPATIRLLHEERSEELILDPQDYGIHSYTEQELSVKDAEDAEHAMRELLEGRGNVAMRDMLILNVGMGIYLLEENSTLPICMAQAREAVFSGVGKKVLL